MNHLSDDLIYTLANKVARESDLTLEEEKAMKHISQCDECYHLLCCMMAIQDVTQNIGALAVKAEISSIFEPFQKPVRAVLQLAVKAVDSVLNQASTGANAWTFCTTPSLLAGARGTGQRSTVKKLTDQQNTKNFVAYDPGKNLLIIQLDASEHTVAPAASITFTNGTEQKISFECRGDIFWTEVAGLDEGDYEISLEK